MGGTIATLLFGHKASSFGRQAASDPTAPIEASADPGTALRAKLNETNPSSCYLLFRRER